MRNLAGRQYAGSVGREADQIGAARPIDRHERRKYRRDQYSAARVRLVARGVILTRGLGLDPLAGVRVGRTDRTAQCTVHAARKSKLHGELSQQIFLLQVAARMPDLMQHRFRDREMLEQRDDVGECLVKREHVGIGLLLKAGMQPVEQRVRGFVRDDVVGERAEHLRSRQRLRRILAAGAEIAEQQRHLSLL